ncbi:Holliday junction branch migration protein RuvA [Heliophilum fasciatum]|uniref:Holliday junction branch migration complex subunit RuvA n=1 Tax=Heliophilum fasciatum TaxID=35700 RepID=A0A4R2RNP0_9FIRM|nr:Holliday junction branch migration protein RuvA [Heliophilum fasciatum]MCW2278071.1 Holliday junction DNA helicase RuvA [Heliophilum fasciatum]TCP64309.1 Holliday junction DNA helicase RuvA [Heliophilum fasciatum]
MIAFLRGRWVGSGEDCLLLEVGGIGYHVYIPNTLLRQLPRQGQEILLHTHYYVREDQAQLFGFLNEEDLALFRWLLEVSGVGPKVGLALMSTFSAQDLQRVIIAEDYLSLTRVPGIGKRTAQRLVIELRDRLLKQGVRPVWVETYRTATPVLLNQAAEPQSEVITGQTATGQATTGQVAAGQATEAEKGQPSEAPSSKRMSGRTKKLAEENIPIKRKRDQREEAMAALQALGYSLNEARDAVVEASHHVERDADVGEWVRVALKGLARL